MKARFLVPVIALCAIGVPGAFAQPADGARSQRDAQQMDERFQRMNAMMGQADTAHGSQLTELMRQHMQLMQDQMQAMHSMIGGGMMGSSMMGGSMMGGGGRANGMMGGNGAAGGNSDMFGRMQARMNVMQQMMEQMLDQQKLMMQSPPK